MTSPVGGVSYPQWALIGSLGWLGYQVWLLTTPGVDGTPAAEDMSRDPAGVVGAAVVVLLVVGFLMYTKRNER